MRIEAANFSTNALWETDYATGLAVPLQARLVFISVGDSPCNLTSTPDSIVATVEGVSWQPSQWANRSRGQMLHATPALVNVPIVGPPDLLTACLSTEATKLNVYYLILGVGAAEPPPTAKVCRLTSSLVSSVTVIWLPVPPEAVWSLPQRIVMVIDLSEPIDTLAINKVWQLAKQLSASLEIICLDNSPDASPYKAAWHIRDLLRYQSDSHTFSFLFGCKVAVALDTYLTQQKAGLSSSLSEPPNWLSSMSPKSITEKVA